jgi:UMP-CMP kinase
METKMLFCLGGPGSGKGTLCQKLAPMINYQHISIGDLLRKEIKDKTQIGSQIEEIVQSGHLVPSEIVIKLINNYLIENPNQKLLIDGFPRNQENWNAFQKAFPNIDFMIILIDTKEEVMYQRVLERQVLEGRNDDNQKIFSERYKIYQEETLPLCTTVINDNKLVVVDGNQEKELVLNQVYSHFVHQYNYFK